jgi:hypothetical protein
MHRSHVITTLAVAVAQLTSPMVVRAQDMSGSVGGNTVTNASCGVACDSLANGTRREDAALRAAIAAVPEAHRPIGFVERMIAVSKGATVSATLKPWALFPNGTATGCYGWDPRRTAPSPTGLRAADKDCAEVASWRRTEQGIVMTDAGQEDSTTYDLLDVQRFASGQRLARRMEATASSISSPAASFVKINDLVFTSAGTVRFAHSKRPWPVVEDTNRPRANQGRYFLDGYLAAIQFPNGRIEVFITGHRQLTGDTLGFTLVYWNGVMFVRE